MHLRHLHRQSDGQPGEEMTLSLIALLEENCCVVPYFVKLIIQQCAHRLSGGQKDTGAAIKQMFNNSENFLGGKDKIKYKNICNVLPTSGLVQSSVFATRKHWYTLHTTHVYTEVIFGWKNLTLN